MTDLPPFDPDSGVDPASYNAVFPDAPDLIAADIAEHGSMDRGFFAAKVPNIPVYVLYGVDDATHVIRIVHVRTWQGSPN